MWAYTLACSNALSYFLLHYNLVPPVCRTAPTSMLDAQPTGSSRSVWLKQCIWILLPELRLTTAPLCTKARQYGLQRISTFVFLLLSFVDLYWCKEASSFTPSWRHSSFPEDPKKLLFPANLGHLHSWVVSSLPLLTINIFLLRKNNSLQTEL